MTYSTPHATRTGMTDPAPPPLPDDLRPLAGAAAADLSGPAAACLRGLNLLMDRAWDEARAAFEAALKADPGNPVALEGLGDALLKLDRKEEAAGRYREAAGKDPDGFAGKSAARKAAALARGGDVRVFGEPVKGGCLGAAALLVSGFWFLVSGF